MDMTKTFKHVFPVGDGCNMAAALSRTGLREYSGPFDWIICSINDILKLIDNNFEDFLILEYLVPDPIPFNAGQCRNSKYEWLMFVHDFAPEEDAPPREEQLPAIQAKYQRRIDYFYNAIKEPTLFFHFEFNGNVEFWKENYARISAFFKKFNPENELVIICYGEPNSKLEGDIPMYFCKSEKDDHVLGYFIESNDELSAFMHRADLIPEKQRMKNLRFFIDKQLNSNRDISTNEIRIARDKLREEQKIWRKWVANLQAGNNFMDQLKADGIKKVGFFGYSGFFEQMVDSMRAADIECDFVSSWYLRGKETHAYGVEIYDPHADMRQLSEEEKKKRDEELEQMSDEDRELMWAKEFSAAPRFKTVDALICVDVEDEDWLMRGRDFFPCKLYALSDLLGK